MLILTVVPEFPNKRTISITHEGEVLLLEIKPHPRKKGELSVAFAGPQSFDIRRMWAKKGKA